MINKLFKAIRHIVSGNLFKGEFRGSNFIDRDISQVLKDLEECEQQTGRFNHNKLKPVFRNAGNTAFICTFWQRMTHFKILVGFLKNKNYSLKNFFVPIAYTHSNAYWFRIGGTSKLAALYPKENLVCKTFGRIKENSNLRRIQSLTTEANALFLNEKINGISTPKLVYDHTKSDECEVPAIWLELVKDTKRKWGKGQQLATRILNSLLEAYKQHGVEFVGFEGLFSDPVTQKHKLDESQLVKNGWEKEEAALIMGAINKVIKSELTFPKSYIHGDAAVGNCIVNKHGELFLIDWELFRKDFIMYDVFNLARSGGGDIKDRYTEWLKQHFPNEYSIANIEIQEGLFSIRRYFHLNRMYQEWISSRSKADADTNLLDRKNKVFCGVEKINNHC